MNPRRLFADQYEGNPDPDLEFYAHYGHRLYAHKASEGGLHIDAAHARRVRQAHDLGLTAMHYHFCRPDQGDLTREARYFWLVVKPTWRPGDMLALDYEILKGGASMAEAQRYIERLWAEVRRISGHTSRVYGSTSFLEVNVAVPWLRFKPRWQAAYGPQPGRMPWGTAYWAWQRSDGAQGPSPHKLAGIPAGDISLLNARTALVLDLRFRSRRRRG